MPSTRCMLGPMSSGHVACHGQPAGERGADTDRPPAAFGVPPQSDFTRTVADLAEFCAGNRDAFERLWLRYRGAMEVLLAGRIRRALEPGLRARLTAELDDILQEASMMILAKLREFEYRGAGSILAWMSRIGTHLVNDRADYWRAGLRDGARELRIDGENMPPPGVPVPAAALVHQGQGPATEHEQRQARRAVAAVLGELPERDHTIVLWRFFGGSTWEEIAAELGAPSGDAVRKEWSDRILPSFAVALARVARSGG